MKRTKTAPARLRARLLGLAALAPFVLLSAAQARDSWQVWLDQAAHLELSDVSSVRAGQSIRFAFEEGEMSTYYLEAGYVRHLRSWLDGGLACLQQYDHRDDRWLEENRPYAEVTARWRTPRLTLSNRCRLEYRMREEQDNTLRLRNKIALQYNAWERSAGLKPYVAAEAFADESTGLNERDQTQFTVGIRTDPERRLLRQVAARADPAALTMDYYLAEQRAKKAGLWTDEYILGMKLGLNF